MEGNHPKIKLLLQALSSDEWECIEEITEEITTYEEVPIREPFTIEKCDLRYFLQIFSVFKNEFSKFFFLIF